jgi:hypothetical protein
MASPPPPSETDDTRLIVGFNSTYKPNSDGEIYENILTNWSKEKHPTYAELNDVKKAIERQPETYTSINKNGNITKSALLTAINTAMSEKLPNPRGGRRKTRRHRKNRVSRKSKKASRSRKSRSRK